MTGKSLVQPSETPLKVFVSSVMDDEMGPWREAIAETLVAASFLRAWMFEYTPASSERLDYSYLRHVRDSDFVVWLVGRNTTEPVTREIGEAISERRRLLVFLLPLEPRDSATQELLTKTKKVAKRSPLLKDVSELEDVLRRTIDDEVARAVRNAPRWNSLEGYEQLGKASQSRCAGRWARAGVGLSQAEAWARDPSLRELPSEIGNHSSGLLAIIGGMGIGKSFTAEAWLQERIRFSSQNPGSPVPVFLSAEDLTSPLTEAVTAAAAGDAGEQGFSLVLDDLSRCSDRGASRLLEQAWALCSLHPSTAVLVTSRPIHGLLTSDTSGTVEARLLSPDKALALLELVCGTEIPERQYRTWAPSLQEATRWPLFAVLTGIYLRDHDMPRRITYSELLSFLINRSLPGTEASTLAASQLLQKLARLTVDADRSLVALADIGHRAELGSVLASGLVELRDKMVGFPIDILREWLAAQSIADGEPTVWELIDDPNRLLRWRYPLMASIGSSDFESGSEVLGPLVEERPGLAARMISEETPEYAAGREGVLSANPETLGEQVRLATESWIFALWPASSFSPAVDREGDLRELGIGVDGQLLTTRWRRGKSGSAVAVVQDDDPKDDWVSYRSGRPPDMSSWPWSWALSDLRQRLARVVRAHNMPIAEGPLLLEFAYEAAREVLRAKTKNGDPIPIQDLADWLAKLRRKPGHVVRYQKGSWIFDPAQLETAVEILRNGSRSDLVRPYPPASPTSGNTWEWFGGDDGMKRAVRSRLTASLDGYRQTVREWFPRLRKDLGHYVLQPAEVRVRLFRPEQAGYAGRLATIFLPRARGKKNRLDIAIDGGDGTFLSWDEQGAWLDEQSARIHAHRKDAAWWLKPKIYQHTIPLFGRTPSCRLAMYWLYEDLFDLSLVDRSPGGYDSFW
jgi:hypothetical protein